MFLDPLTQEIYFIDGGQIWDMNFNPIDFTTDDISTPHHPDGKYRSYCNDPMNDFGIRRDSTTYQLAMCNYNSARLTDYTFVKKITDDQLKQLVYRNPVVIFVNVSVKLLMIKSHFIFLLFCEEYRYKKL